ncbi:MAG: hypothetical protein ACK5JR_19110 [Tropicimonas sp.]|uniref:hypothetical protein n=1 Tax=Tropicimonas sp. TaxID=2067044 RepID=UPI003A8C0669
MDDPDERHAAATDEGWQEALLHRIADELCSVEEILGGFQNGLSDVIERTMVSAETMKRFQGLDEAMQVLGDLSRAVRIVAEHRQSSQALCLACLDERIVMGGLRLRLCGEPPAASPAGESRQGEVSLF